MPITPEEIASATAQQAVQQTKTLEERVAAIELALTAIAIEFRWYHIRVPPALQVFYDRQK